MSSVAQNLNEGLKTVTLLPKRLGDVAELLVDQMGNVAKSADSFVRSSPWGALGAGALAGLIAGLVVGSTSRRRGRSPSNQDSLQREGE
ncbi:MAG: hypothetical protein M3O06_08965 [Pseudomonadota bacterium]|nr:hypothetical protein [Pseudomonadota bacterium]